jgi:hypothetical protein
VDPKRNHRGEHTIWAGDGLAAVKGDTARPCVGARHGGFGAQRPDGDLRAWPKSELGVEPTHPACARQGEGTPLALDMVRDHYINYCYLCVVVEEFFLCLQHQC